MRLRKKIKIGLAAIVAALTISTTPARAEETYYSTDTGLRYTYADTAVLTANAGLGCIVSALPAALRGRKVSTVGANCLKGIVAGGITYGGLKLASISSYGGMGWLGHNLVDLGTSMQENMARGYRALDRVAYDIGPLRLAIGTHQANDGSFLRMYVLPGSVVGVLVNTFEGNDFNEKASLYNGTLVYDSYSKDGILRDTYAAGHTWSNVITMRHRIPTRNGNREVVYRDAANTKEMAKAFNHEQVHATQYRQWGLMDVALQNSDSYNWLRNKARLDFSSDAGLMSMLALSRPFPEKEDKAIEWTASNLSVGEADVMSRE